MILELAKILFIFIYVMSIVPFLIYAERRIAAFIQDRLGPNRVGPFGFLQPLADVIKLLAKEDIIPKNADKFLYVLAPLMAFVPPVLVFSVVPIGKPVEISGYRLDLQVCDLGLSLIIFMALVSLAVYGVAFGGWASNNKYSLLGALRSTAQLISYELVLTLSLICMVISTGTLSLKEIVDNQTAGVLSWNIFSQPLAAMLFYISALAENKRLPFDLPEAESELVGGYHTEYSSMKFAMFFMGEYVAITAMSALFVTLFLGGWCFPGLPVTDHSIWSSLISILIFTIKLFAVIFVYMWIRWTLPRFKYNHLMQVSWKGLVPLAFLNLVLTALINL